MRLEFNSNSLADLMYFIKEDRKKAMKIMKLIEEVLKNPFNGIGKPEPLKYLSTNVWSRRIDECNRLVYKVEKDCIVLLACRYHY